MEYWGARSFFASGGPEGVNRYTPSPAGPSQWTMPNDDKNSATIDEIHRQLMAQHPEIISLLADEWQNAYNMLANIRGQLLDESNALYNESWRNSDARDAFMKAGPGITLAFLDDWMTGASNNVSALRALVGIATESRTTITNTWNDFMAEVQKAKTLDGGEEFKTFWQLWKSWPDAERDEKINDLNHVQDKYNKLARGIAWDVANQYFDTLTSGVANGFGPPYSPMDVVLNVPGHPKWTPPPGAPSLAGLTPPPGLNAPPAPPAPPAAPPAPPAAPPAIPTDPAQLQLLMLANLRPPPGAPDLSRLTAPAGPPAEADPGMAARLAAQLAALQAGTAPAGLTAELAAASTLGLRGGVFGGGGAPGMPGGGSAPGMGRPPGAPPSLGNGSRGRGRPGGLSRDDQRKLGAMPEENEDAFSRPSTGTSPPVLSGPRSGQRGPGDRDQQFRPPAAELTDTPLPERPDAVSPVLNSPAMNASRSMPPPPPGGQRERRSQGSPPARANPTDVDWMDQEGIRADAISGTIAMPPPVAPGPVGSGLEEVPATLRRAVPPVPGRGAKGSRPGTVAPELGGRRATPTNRSGSKEDEKVEHEENVVTNVDAFTVETPGGAVLTTPVEDHPHQSEPPAALGRS
jgi:hypothetical protein